jgi:soluble lytic murein transglycosylase-like protein
MPEIKTRRPYQERFLDGYDRHELREQVQKVKPSRCFSGLRKKTAAWGLGASLVLGGLGVPLAKLGVKQPQNAAKPERNPASPADPAGQARPATASSFTAGILEPALPAPAAAPAIPAAVTTEAGIAQDLETAQKIASEVTGGVNSAVQDVAQVATAAPAAASVAPVEVAHVVATAAETLKASFFESEVPFGGVIYQEAKRNALSPELLAAVVHTESKFNPAARSQAGAVGLMQLVPRTGKWLGARDLTNPAQNISAGAKYLRYLTDRFNGDTQRAVAAYNAGEGNVRRFGGVPPFRETRDYVSRVNDYQSELGDRIAGQNRVDAP